MLIGQPLGKLWWTFFIWQQFLSGSGILFVNYTSEVQLTLERVFSVFGTQ